MTGEFNDLSNLPEGDKKVRRVLLSHPEERNGPFAKLLGPTQLELIQSIERTDCKKIFENRYWGDWGFIHLCFDIQRIDALKKEFSNDQDFFGMFKGILNNDIIKTIKRELEVLGKEYEDLRKQINMEVVSLKTEVEDTQRKLERTRYEIDSHNDRAKQMAEIYKSIMQKRGGKISLLSGSKQKTYTEDEMIDMLEKTLQINQGQHTQIPVNSTITYNTHGPNIHMDADAVGEAAKFAEKNGRLLKIWNMTRKLKGSKKKFKFNVSI